jgi:NAD(P)-dependent dehydrogenase (short-subunit alcohol dehydrogenase family)
VREFARHGADIGLIARGEDGLNAAAREVEACGGRALVLPVDVADAAQVQSAADEVERRLGPIDIWINDARRPWELELPRAHGGSLRAPAGIRIACLRRGSAPCMVDIHRSE